VILVLNPDLGHYRAIILCGMWAEVKGVLWNRAGPDKISYVGKCIYMAYGHKPDLGQIINGPIWATLPPPTFGPHVFCRDHAAPSLPNMAQLWLTGGQQCQDTFGPRLLAMQWWNVTNTLFLYFNTFFTVFLYFT